MGSTGFEPVLPIWGIVAALQSVEGGPGGKVLAVDVP